MDIQRLPVELQEKILVNVAIDTKIELVCKLWNEICKKHPISTPTNTNLDPPNQGQIPPITKEGCFARIVFFAL